MQALSLETDAKGTIYADQLEAQRHHQLMAVATGGDVVAALPMRLNEDAQDDFVVLTAADSAPTTVRTQAVMTFVVTNAGDNGGVNPNPGAGTGTLRQAIVDANANAGPDTIQFN